MKEEPKNSSENTVARPSNPVLWAILLVVIYVFALAIGLVTGSFGWAGSIALTVLGTCLVAFIRWVCCWRNFKRFLFGVACVVTLIALAYAEENWRGKHDWEQFKSDWAAKGEKFDFDAIVPPPVPDNDNFAMAPLFDATDKLASRKWREEHRNRNQGRNGSEWDMNLVDPLDISVGPDAPDKGSGDWQRSQMSDLQSWQKYYRDLAAKTNTYPVTPQPQTPAQDVLLALSTYDSVLEQLRQAALRPQSRFPLDYDDEDPAEILLPHLAALKRCSLVLRLRALAELQNGQPDKALADVKLSLRLADTIRTEPFIITHLVRIAILQISLQPVWEGLAEHKWSDAELVELDSALAKFDFLADYQFSVRGERAMHIKVVDWMEQKRSRYWEIENMVDDNTRNEMNNFGKAVRIYLMPKGWFYQNELTIARLDQNWILPAADVAQQTISPKMIAQAQTNINSSLQPGAFSIFGRLLVPALGSYARKAAYGQNAANLARTAIALERYHLATSAYPNTLDVLAPDLIAQVPHDVIGGQPSQGSGPASQPLKYRRDANGQFVLYSVGWNETDDGGVIAFKKSNDAESSVNLDEGDWVWKYPAK
jgi:hypothetical protein